MKERWRMEIELTFVREEEDSPFDSAYSGRGTELYRAKTRLNELLDDKPFVHYHILGYPHKTTEGD